MVIELSGLTFFTKHVLTLLTVFSCTLMVFIVKAQPLVPSTLTAEQFSKLHQCDKKFAYDIYFLGKNVGYLHRTIQWHKNSASVQAVVSSYGEVSFLWLDSTYQQKSTMQYSPQYQHFLTTSFSQQLTGIKARVMKAEMSANGLSSRVTLNTEVSHYQQNNEDQPLYDLDTLGAQIRLNLIQGKTHFTLFRQASSKVERYKFEVVGLDVIHHQQWGPITTIKVVEVGEHTDIVLWFSAKHDHQLIKAQLDMIFSPVVWLSYFSKQCKQ
ncbi:hypothetical protein MTCD1_03212 [Colwellia marinimaniae]|uniref:DUF3108 domain-containing protein n=1 Tax=Colwellia marinimaniae TaxID=1513592 RepID=A0ABQ0MYY4_9GAMM|nr:hypothetical protein MTCD1_03212 [Colwellia marinimaniae]